MNLKEAKERMKFRREKIKEFKKERMKLTELINTSESDIREIKGAIFRGEIK